MKKKLSQFVARNDKSKIISIKKNSGSDQKDIMIDNIFYLSSMADDKKIKLQSSDTLEIELPENFQKKLFCLTGNFFTLFFLFSFIEVQNLFLSSQSLTSN